MLPPTQAAAETTATSAPTGDDPIPEVVGFNDHIRPILVKHCVGCHGGPKQAAGVTFLHRDGALMESDYGTLPIVAGDVEESAMMGRITEPDDEMRMPPPDHGPRLNDREVELVRRWIAQGAKWEEHWSLVAARQTAKPEVDAGSWPRASLDRYVLRRLEQEGFQPAPDASREAWLRRVTFDLIGLPPTEGELSDFLADDSPEAHQRVVDRLLASPRYGERWASLWMDLARYSDTMGYEKDPHRDVWPYRDWLIRALNADMPYDEFTIKQLAGDLLEKPTLDDRLATAFHRNTQTNTEGGTDDEEFRIAAVMDRTNTTWQVWMATTYGCAQCHAHPYDAFKHEDYYSFTAFFNTSRDSDTYEDFPRLAVPVDREKYAEAGELDLQIEAARREWLQPATDLAADAGQWVNLKLDRYESTGSTELSFVEEEGVGELYAGGTITYNSRYKLEGPAPAASGPVTALRIDAMPKDLEQAVKTPEIGFVLSRLRLQVLEPGAEPRAVEFSEVYGDDPNPAFDPRESLRDNNRGWAAYTRIYQPRHAVFVLKEPLQLGEGARLRLVLKQNRNLDGQGALVIRRARFSLSADTRWTRLATDAQQAKLTEHIGWLKWKRSQIKSVNVPVMGEREVQHHRRSFVFDRGDWLNKSDEVQPATPSSMPPMPSPEGDRPASRLEMAKWIASVENPLTSRTMVNRVWAQLFGIGLVETEEDFGGAGEMPTHPELLDHLALKFSSDYAWSLKRLMRELVLSATYRQDSRVRSDLMEVDARNRLLGRGPRQRLTAEMVRDQALVLSGKYADKMYGRPVMPYQPEGIWQSVYSGARWENATGENRFRRAVYTYWKRTSAYPSLMGFDMPTREVCTVRRITTNTPLQALVTMNDPAYIELAQGFAARIAEQGEGGTVRDKLGWAYRVATGKRPHEMSLAELEKLYADAATHFQADPEGCKPLAEDAERFALVVVANAVMNLDDALTR
ncbi:MAG: PSD1 and planctomycete cytochrome C domain-containing protein [Planctomycetota bacterium]